MRLPARRGAGMAGMFGAVIHYQQGGRRKFVSKKRL